MKPLNQIEKRLQIVKTAISLTDEETIHMQLSKLRLYKNDKQLENILSVLDDENYVQASNLIDRYIHGPYDEAGKTEIQQTEALESEHTNVAEEEEKKVHSREEEELLKKFGSFMEEASRTESQNVDEEEILSLGETVSPHTAYSEEKRLATPHDQPSAEDILAEYENIEEEKIPQSNRMAYTPPRQTIQTKTQDRQEMAQPDDENEEETFFDIDEVSSLQGDHPYYNEGTSAEAEANMQNGSPSQDALSTNGTKREEKESDLPTEQPESTESAAEEERVEEIETTEYAPISYIDQKFRNMRNQYPQIEESPERFESEEKLLYLISLEGYTEADIEEAIDTVYQLKEEGKLAEAAHLLLIAAATESVYAQYILARELFKGQILQRDLPEAFTQINRLAMNDYPEAVCDLAQFYEHGIGIDKDKKKAFELYEDALELGVDRAEAHLNRMEEESRGFFGKLLSKLSGKK